MTNKLTILGSPESHTLLAAFRDDERDFNKKLTDRFLGELDPHGVDQHAPGAKLDAGKIDVGLLWESFPYALMAIADVATFGANKYTRGGWKEVAHGFVRYKAAEGRHMLYRHQGETRDKDSGRYHLSHEGWNKLAQLEFFLKEQQEKI